MIYLDTHVAVWLFAGELNRFSEAALESMEAEELAISPVVLLELQYLRETDRIKASPRALTNALARTIGLKICDISNRASVNAKRILQGEAEITLEETQLFLEIFCAVEIPVARTLPQPTLVRRQPG